jgi:hypothetical protein
VEGNPPERCKIDSVSVRGEPRVSVASFPQLLRNYSHYSLISICPSSLFPSLAAAPLIMPPAPPIAYATLSSPLPTTPYILSIAPSPSAHLILRHPSPTLTLADPQTLQPIETFRDGHSGHVTDVTVDQDAIWSSARDASVVRWDERSRSAAMSIKGE